MAIGNMLSNQIGLMIYPTEIERLLETGIITTFPH